jgi:hypothetical protein
LAILAGYLMPDVPFNMTGHIWQFAAPEVFVVLTHCVEYPAEFTNFNQIASSAKFMGECIRFREAA